MAVGQRSPGRTEYGLISGAQVVISDLFDCLRVYGSLPRRIKGRLVFITPMKEDKGEGATQHLPLEAGAAGRGSQATDCM